MNHLLFYYAAELRQEISTYLSSIRDHSGLISDIEYYLEKTLELLEKPSITIKRLKSIALQIQGQFTIELEVVNSLQHSFLPDYIRFRKNPPHRVLELCGEIMELPAIREEAKQKNTHPLKKEIERYQPLAVPIGIS